MNYSYDYSEMIGELEDELQEGILQKLDTIFVLRSEKSFPDGYKPIIDWYYENTEEIIESEKEKEAFMKDKPHLEKILAELCLDEMKERNKLISF